MAIYGYITHDLQLKDVKEDTDDYVTFAPKYRIVLSKKAISEGGIYRVS